MKLPVEYEQEDAGRWIAAIPQILGVVCYGVSCNDAERPRWKPEHSESSADCLDESEMTASPITIETMESAKHEPMAVFEGTTCIGGARSDWLASQAASRITPNPQPPRLAGCSVRISRRGKEIGPKMLARLVKRRGLTPENIR